jgi:hypothetical protein
MIHGKKILVVLPAFRVERTPERTCAEVPGDAVDAILLVDDGTDDETMEIAERMGVEAFLHLNFSESAPGSPRAPRGCRQQVTRAIACRPSGRLSPRRSNRSYR